MALTTTTKLEAVNTMLGSIGEAPVNSLSSGLVDAETAEKILDAVSREVQSMGWSFNTNFKVNYTPDSTRQITLTSNILRAEMAQARTDSLDVVQRGLKLYNRATNSYYYSTDVDGVLMNTVMLIEFEDMSEAAKRYVTLKSARIFQDRVVGSSELHGFQQRDELMALVELKDSEAQVDDHTIFDNYSVSSVLDRVGGRVI